MANRIQEWFTTMVKGLAAQQWERAVKTSQGSDMCLYRMEDGKKCAIGQIIPDDAQIIQYGVGIANLTLEELFTQLGLGHISQDEFQFLKNAQNAHDLPTTSNQVREQFLGIRKQYGLDWPADVAVQ